ncbi:DAPG hydrolase family protein [Spongisporangium articulatum]|uniref:DAPG hydrolase family protein n=1 Tax=Spongisporangium articulatum TaxID=3362603 RepID=A0ABW8AKK0_9ACTN
MVTPEPPGPQVSRRGAFQMAGLAGVGLLGGSKPAGIQPKDSAPFSCIPRYLGYREADLAKPYASFFTGKTAPVQPQVTQALAAGPFDPALGVPLGRLDDELSISGYSAVETGYTILGNGQALVACLTDMPGVRPEMWDWWFGWHSWESARYKLWHPDAHEVAVMREDRSGDRTLSDRERYVGNTSFVDEYIGPHLEQLAIRFRDPAAAGFSAKARAGALIYARVGSSMAPVDLGWVVHQVRATPTGSEMRSRFYLNVPGVASVLDLNTGCGLVRGLAPLPNLPFGKDFAAHLMQHCGAEMNHLSRFLPDLYARFKDTP